MDIPEGQRGRAELSVDDRVAIAIVWAAAFASSWIYYSAHQGFMQLGGSYASQAILVYGLQALMVVTATWLWAARPPERGVGS